MPSATDLINMISGIYTSPLWEELKFYSTSLDTLRKIQKSIAALQECGKSMEAFGLVVALHDLTELDVPEAITGLEAFPDGIKMFMDEFIADTHDLMLVILTVFFYLHGRVALSSMDCADDGLPMTGSEVQVPPEPPVFNGRDPADEFINYEVLLCRDAPGA